MTPVAGPPWARSDTVSPGPGQRPATRRPPRPPSVQMRARRQHRAGGRDDHLPTPPRRHGRAGRPLPRRAPAPGRWRPCRRGGAARSRPPPRRGPAAPGPPNPCRRRRRRPEDPGGRRGAAPRRRPRPAPGREPTPQAPGARLRAQDPGHHSAPRRCASLPPPALPGSGSRVGGPSHPLSPLGASSPYVRRHPTAGAAGRPAGQPGRMPFIRASVRSITSSAPPPIDHRRVSRKNRAGQFSST